MALARAVVTAALALRNDAGLGVRQPLAELLVVTDVDGVDEASLRSVESVILDEVNVKRLQTVSGDGGLVRKSARPNFKTLGRRLGKNMGAAKALITTLPPEAIAAYERDGQITLPLAGEEVVFVAGDIEVVSEGVEGRPVRQEASGDRTVTVSLDTTLSDELRSEGLAREFVNRVQALRRDADYEVTDRIEIAYAAPEAVTAAIVAHRDYVASETLALAITPSEASAVTGDAVVETDFGHGPVTIAVRRAVPSV